MVGRRWEPGEHNGRGNEIQACVGGWGQGWLQAGKQWGTCRAGKLKQTITTDSLLTVVCGQLCSHSVSVQASALCRLKPPGSTDKERAPTVEVLSQHL